MIVCISHHSVVCVREELMIATRSGQLLRLRWDGDVNAEMTIRLSVIPFSVDLQHSRGMWHSLRSGPFVSL